jgi:hypothetical protein
MYPNGFGAIAVHQFWLVAWLIGARDSIVIFELEKGYRYRADQRRSYR